MGVFNEVRTEYKIKTIDTAEDVDLGGFYSTSKFELSNMRLLIYKNGTPGGSETATIKLYPNEDFDVPTYTSDVFTFSNIPDFGEFWIGWVRFDFNREVINLDADGDFPYFPRLEMANYTRNADTFYFSTVMNDAVASMTFDQTPNDTYINAKDGSAYEVFGYS